MKQTFYKGRLPVEEKRFTIRGTEELHAKLTEDAANHRRSLNQQVLEILHGVFDEDWLQRRIEEIRKAQK